MKIAYFDCFSGAAGDMIVGACLDAGADNKHLQRQLARVNLPEVEIHIRKLTKNGIAATRFEPVIKKSHPHSRHLPDIKNIIQNARLSDYVTRQALKIFDKLARAEAKVHNTNIDKIHFHEVGAADAVIDIVGACIAVESLGIENIYCSALTTGCGAVSCAHGILPVPAPATAELIKGIPLIATDIQLELLTPTGAAILTTLSESFGTLPSMRIDAIGYGAGKRDYPNCANVLRLLVGAADASGSAQTDTIYLLEANLDDATGELIGHVTQKLLRTGALDVFCTAIAMKKNRPATQISVICRESEISDIERILFLESTTLGIRRHTCQRTILPWEYQTVTTPYGKIRMKIGRFDGKIATCSVEFADCEKAAQKHHVSVKTVIADANAVYHRQNSDNNPKES